MNQDFIELKNEISSIRKDLDLIKKLLLHEGQLTDYAKKELMLAREEDELNYSSLGDVKKKILEE
jgi:hypothetical protein